MEQEAPDKKISSTHRQRLAVKQDKKSDSAQDARSMGIDQNGDLKRLLAGWDRVKSRGCRFVLRRGCYAALPGPA